MQPEALFAIIALIFSIILHEVAHGYVAWLLGDPTARNEGRLTLNPLPHIDPLGSIILPGLLVLTSSSILMGWARPVPYDPRNLRNGRIGEGMVAVAGSATNLILAAIFAAIIHLGAAAGASETFLSLATVVVYVNVFLAVFNLLPLPPLDGFTVLRTLLPYRLGGRILDNIEYKVASLGPWGLIGALLIIIFLLVPIVLFFVRAISALLLPGAGL